MFTGRKLKIILHVLAWALLIGFPLYLMKRWEAGKDFIWIYYINTLISGCIFYINYLGLIPRFFFRDRVKYYISLAILITGFYFISDQSNKLVFRYVADDRRMEESKPLDENKTGRELHDVKKGRPPFRQIHMFNYGMNSLFLIFFSLGLTIVERHVSMEKRQKELEKEKLNSELAFLKNQISPHFFFNTLNNIYSLIGINGEDAQNAILKLSKMMRYLLYESEQGLSNINHEIEFMNHYIDLMRLRMSDKVDLKVDFPLHPENAGIPPLLFIPFIENAFKHGISYREKSFIKISMQVEKESIIFECKNSMTKARDDSAESKSGIGLDNVKKRLALLFQDKHDLKIERSEHEFSVRLVIQLTKRMP
jgi:two-component system, LytTR family, sensor kinase